MTRATLAVNLRGVCLSNEENCSDVGNLPLGTCTLIFGLTTFRGRASEGETRARKRDRWRGRMLIALAVVVALLVVAVARLYKRGRRIMIARELANTHTAEDIAELRAMALAHPRTCSVPLAAGLNNLAIRQGLSGQHADALQSMREATAIIRNLPLGHRSREGYLAQFLGGLCVEHRLMGERELAHAAGRESVEIWRKMVNVSSDYLPDLALGLQNLSAAQDTEEALASSAEAVRLIRPLVEDGSPGLLRILAGSLENLGGAQLGLHQVSESVTTLSEAIAIRRQLAVTEPAAMLPLLAGLLSSLGAAQSELGEQEQSLASLTEALRILRGLVKENADAHLPMLAGCLMNLAATHRKRGRPVDAVEPAREAVSLFRPLAQKIPAAYSGLMRDAVALLEEVLRETGGPPSGDHGSPDYLS
jgi:tetratricopeptide (TPR) repeat protein